MNFSQQALTSLKRTRRRVALRASAAGRAAAGAHEAVALVTGSGMIAYGAAEVYNPAGWIIGGVAVVLCFGPFGGPGDDHGVPA